MCQMFAWRVVLGEQQYAMFLGARCVFLVVYRVVSAPRVHVYSRRSVISLLCKLRLSFDRCVLFVEHVV